MVFSAQLGDVGGKGVKALTLSHTHSLKKLARAGCSQIHSLWMGHIVDSEIGLSYQPASLCSLAGRYDNPMPKSTLSPQSGTMNLATLLSLVASLESQRSLVLRGDKTQIRQHSQIKELASSFIIFPLQIFFLLKKRIFWLWRKSSLISGNYTVYSFFYFFYFSLTVPLCTDYDFSIFPEIDYVSLSSKSVFLLLLILIVILILFKLLFSYSTFTIINTNTSPLSVFSLSSLSPFLLQRPFPCQYYPDD